MTFEALITDFCRQVRENEPGTVYYEVSRNTKDPASYIVIEIYRDEAAFEAHKSKDYFKATLAKAGPLVDDTIVTRYETFSV